MTTASIAARRLIARKRAATRQTIVPAASFSSSSSVSSSRHYDVLIVGGGAVGSALASTLRRLTPSLSLGLIEPRVPPPLSSFDPASSSKGHGASSPSARAYALSPASLDLLGRKRGDGGGAIDRLDGMGRVGYYDRMQVWEHDGPATLTFTNRDLMKGVPDEEALEREDVLGAVVEDGPLVSALWDELREDSAVDLLGPAVVKSVNAPGSIGGVTPPPHVRVDYMITSPPSGSISGGEGIGTATASLLVAADGANSHVRRALGMPTVGFGYGRRALTCTVKLDRPIQRTAHQRFLPEGPVALLPVWTEMEGGGDYYANIVWSTTPSHSDKLKGLTEAEFILELNDALQRGPSINPPLLSENFRSSLPAPLAGIAYGIETVLRGANDGLTMSRWSERHGFLPPPLVSGVSGPRLAFDLSLSHAQAYVGPRVALIGDAAHTVHPMAGQGLNLGLADAECLSRSIEEAVRGGMDPGGTMHFLNSYQSERQREVMAALAGIHALHVAFGMTFPPAVYARSLGMNLVDFAGPVRRRLAEVAAGRVGAFPR